VVEKGSATARTATASAAARWILESLAANMEVWLRPEHEATAPAICAVRKIHHLITPGEQEVCPE